MNDKRGERHGPGNEYDKEEAAVRAAARRDGSDRKEVVARLEWQACVQQALCDACDLIDDGCGEDAGERTERGQGEHGGEREGIGLMRIGGRAAAWPAEKAYAISLDEAGCAERSPHRQCGP